LFEFIQNADIENGNVDYINMVMTLLLTDEE